MRWRNRITGGIVITDGELAYPYERLHEEEDCWCESVPPEVNTAGEIPRDESGRFLPREDRWGYELEEE